jgi:hypothetical protein
VNDARLSSLNYKNFWPLIDQIKVSFVRAAGVLPKGRMFDMLYRFDPPWGLGVKSTA